MRTMYRYKLNENSKHDQVMLSNFPITKNWKCVYSKPDNLDTFIRTKNNPKGIVDFEVLDLDSGNQIIQSSFKDFKNPIKLYTRDQLGLMLRDELVKIATILNIDCFGLNENFLVKKILVAQQEYMEHEEERYEQQRLEDIASKISETGQDLEFLP